MTKEEFEKFEKSCEEIGNRFLAVVERFENRK
jgi:hypothetical protein